MALTLSGSPVCQLSFVTKCVTSLSINEGIVNIIHPSKKVNPFSRSEEGLVLQRIFNLSFFKPKLPNLSPKNFLHHHDWKRYSWQKTLLF